MLRRLVSWSYDHRRRVVALWVAGLVAATVLAGSAGGDTEVDFTVPGSDSAEAVALLQDRFPSFAGGRVDVVYTSEDGVDRPGDRGPGGRAGPGPRRGRQRRRGGARAGLARRPDRRAAAAVRRGRASRCRSSRSSASWTSPARPAGDGLQVELGGYPIETVEQSEAGSEAVGLRRRPGHPADRVRLRAGRRPAPRRRRLRPGRGARRRVADGQRARRPRLRGAARHDDRHRRGHRLRAVHRHPVPLGAGRGPRAPSGRRARRDDRRPGGAVRRRHGRDLALRPRADGPRLPVGRRRSPRRWRCCRGGRVGHAAARRCSASPGARSTGCACPGSATTSTAAARCRGGGAGWCSADPWLAGSAALVVLLAAGRAGRRPALRHTRRRQRRRRR